LLKKLLARLLKLLLRQLLLFHRLLDERGHFDSLCFCLRLLGL
jgi:hypothetical protein